MIICMQSERGIIFPSRYIAPLDSWESSLEYPVCANDICSIMAHLCMFFLQFELKFINHKHVIGPSIFHERYSEREIHKDDRN